MPLTTEIEITDAELGLALKKGVSLDKYVEVRRKSGISPTRARNVASIRNLTVEDYETASSLGLRYGQIIGLTQSSVSIKYVLDFMKAGATYDEAFEACRAYALINGSFGYVALRFGSLGISHRAIVDACLVAVEADVSRELYLAYTFVTGISSTHAIEAARVLIDPVYYILATAQEFSHQEIIDSCSTQYDMDQFQKRIAAEQNSIDAIADLRHLLYDTR